MTGRSSPAAIGLAVVVAVTILAGVPGCSFANDEPGATMGQANEHEIVERPDWGEHFDAEGTIGTFALHEVGSSEVQVFDEIRATQRALPASTFKILNSLIILETGVMADVDTVVAWDGVDRGLAAWNKDHTLRSAIAVSAVWVYQALARQVGDEQMRRWVAAADYGNEDIGGPIDSFWLEGDLRISAMEQIDFLTRLESGQLPFGDENQRAVREILLQESGPGWSWSYKTGWAMQADPELGWLVGMVEQGGSSWVFALNADLESGGEDLDPALRVRVARAILLDEGVLPPP